MQSALSEVDVQRERIIEEEVLEYLQVQKVVGIDDLNAVINRRIIEGKIKRYEVKMSKLAMNCDYLLALEFKLYCKVLNKNTIKFSMYLYDSNGKEITFSGNGEMERFKRHLLQNCKNYLCECIIEGIYDQALETIFCISRKESNLNEVLLNALKR